MFINTVECVERMSNDAVAEGRFTLVCAKRSMNREINREIENRHVQQTIE